MKSRGWFVRPEAQGAPAPACAICRHFRNDPADLEVACPGLASLSSAYASVRADDGLCAMHDRFVAARALCPAFGRR